MVPLWFSWLERGMPTTLTLKNIPDEIYMRLKDLAATHRRSLNSQAISCLESVLVHNKISLADRLERARELRSGLRRTAFRIADLDKLKRLGRS
jgi:plasmid stability protein